MNITELRNQYKKETGKDAPESIEVAFQQEQDYIQWLEEKALKHGTITVKGSDIVKMDKIQNYKDETSDT